MAHPKMQRARLDTAGARWLGAQPSPPAAVRWLVGGTIAALGVGYGVLIALLPISFYLQISVPILLILGAAVWSLPETGKVPDRAIELLFFGYMCGLFLWPNYFAIAIPGLPWMTMSRLWGAPLAALIVYSCAVSSAFRARLGAPFATHGWFRRAMLGFLLCQIGALFFSKHFGDSANRLVNYLIAWTGMFFAGSIVLQRPGRATRLATLLMIFAIAQASVAYFEYRAGGVLWAQHVPPFVALNDPTVQAILAGGARAATGTYRVQSIYTTSLNFAEFLGCTLVLFLQRLFTTPRLWVRLLCGVYVPCCFWTILTTDSRIGLVGYFLTLMVYFLCWAVRRQIADKRGLIAPFLLMLYPVGAGIFVGLALFWTRLNHMIFGGGAQAASNESRQIQIATGIPKVLRWPFGYGPGMGAQTLGFADNEEGKLTIDNYWLSIALEYGVMGFICFMALMLLGISNGVRYGLRAKDPELQLLLPFGVLVFIFITGKSVLS